MLAIVHKGMTLQKKLPTWRTYKRLESTIKMRVLDGNFNFVPHVIDNDWNVELEKFWMVYSAIYYTESNLRTMPKRRRKIGLI